MHVLVIGGGGREHALAWKLKRSPRVKKLTCAPGNAGMAQLGECVAVDVNDVAALASLAERSKADRKSTRLNSSHIQKSRMPSSA